MTKKVTITPSFFPASDHLLPQLSISERQHEELRTFALQVAHETIRDGPTWGRSNVENAVSRGWKVLSAKPTACLLIKRHKSKTRSPVASPATVLSPAAAADVVVTPMSATQASKKLSNAGITLNPRTPQSAPIPTAASYLSSANASGQSYMGHSVLPNSLEDVMNTTYQENTSEMRIASRKIYGDYLLDCCVLQTLEGATMDDPFWYLGLKWAAVRSPFAKIVASREFVYLEHSGTHIDADGRRMLYRILQSVHVRGYGGQDSYFGLTRAHLETAFVYWMEPSGDQGDEVLNVCMKGRFHPKGSLPLSLVYKYIKKLWKSERSMFATGDTSSSSDGGALQSKKKKRKKKKKSKSNRQDRIVLEGAPLEMALRWVPDEDRKRCSVCQKKFHILKRLKHHCRACGEIICRACTFYHKLVVRDRRSMRQTLPSSFFASRRDFEEDEMDSSESSKPGKSSSEASGAGGSSNGSTNHSDRHAASRSSAVPAVLGDDDQVLTVVEGKVCHRCIHGKSVIVVTRPHSASHAFASSSSLASEFPTQPLDLTTQFDSTQGPITLSSRSVRVWNHSDSLDLPELKHHAFEHQPRLTEDLPMILADVDTGSVAGFDESKTFLATKSRTSLMTSGRPSTIVAGEPEHEPVSHPEEDDEEESDEEESDEEDRSARDRRSSVAESSSSASSSLTSSQMRVLLDTDGSGSSSTASKVRRSTIDELSEGLHDGSISRRDHRCLGLDADDDDDDFEFYPMTGTTATLMSSSTSSGEATCDPANTADLETTFAIWGFDPDCLFELKDEDEGDKAKNDESLYDSDDLAIDKGDVQDRIRKLEDDILRQEVLAEKSPEQTPQKPAVASRASIGEKGLGAALSQMESSLADQAYLLSQLQQARANGNSIITPSKP